MATHFYYLHRADLERGYPRVKWVSDTPIEDYQTRGSYEGLNLREYQSDALPERLIYDAKQAMCRPPTEQEKHDLAPDLYVPPQDHYVKTNKVRAKPLAPSSMLYPRFDPESEQWIEIATDEQIEDQEKRVKQWAYLDELGRYGYARSEHAIGIVSDTELAEATAYLQALAEGSETTRPVWFSRYTA